MCLDNSLPTELRVSPPCTGPLTSVRAIVVLMNIGVLPRRCRPFSLTESGPLKSRTKHNNGVRVPIFSLLLTSSNARPWELELELIQSHMTQKPMLRGEVGACRFTQLTSTAKRKQSVQLVERPLNAKVGVPPSIGSSRC